MTKEEELIVENISANFMCGKPNMVYENYIENHGKYRIEIYNRNNKEDYDYIRNHRRDIKDFFDAGYIATGQGIFGGCGSSKDVKRKTILLKVARDIASIKIIAMTIYGEQPTGSVKCVGATVIADDSLRDLGKDALENIIASDMGLFEQFYWTEASGAIAHWCEKHNGIKIPNTYLTMFIREDKLSDIKIENGELYKYKRTINVGNEIREVEKTVFEFPNKETMEKYIEDRNTTLEQMYAQLGREIPFHESLQTFNIDDVKKEYMLLHYYYYDLYDEYLVRDLTEMEMEYLDNAISKVDTALEILDGKISPMEYQKMYDFLEYCKIIRDTSTVIRIYKLGEYLVPEEVKYIIIDD